MATGYSRPPIAIRAYSIQHFRIIMFFFHSFYSPWDLVVSTVGFPVKIQPISWFFAGKINICIESTVEVQIIDRHEPMPFPMHTIVSSIPLTCSYHQVYRL